MILMKVLPMATALAAMSVLVATCSGETMWSSSRNFAVHTPFQPLQSRKPILNRFSNPNSLSIRTAVSLRGGGEDGAMPVSSASWEVTPANILAYTGALALAGLTVGLVRKIPRSAGRAPEWLTQFLPDPLATAVLHMGYFIHCILVVKIMPLGLREVVFSPSGITLLGTLFPVVESIRAVTTETAQDDQLWLQYWIMQGAFSYSTEFVDKMAEKSPFLHRHWLPFHFYALLWLILPMTDGASVSYELLTKPYLVPLVTPIKKLCEGWLTTLALTLVNASYLWWFAVIFMALPVFLKRLAVIATGTIFPILGTIVAVATPADTTNLRWLTYWSCFSLLFLAMSTTEKFVGSFTGLYTLCLGATLYLMLPIFDGSIAVFRQILVPLFRQREALIVKDAKMLAKELLKQLPADRHEAVRKAAAAAFLDSK